MKKRVCFCIDSLRVGGAESLLVDIINLWDDANWDIFLCCLEPVNHYRHRLEWKKITEYTCFPSTGKVRLIAKAFSYCKRNRIQVVNTHLERPNKWFGLGARMAGAKVVSTVHSINIYDTFPSYKILTYKYLYNIVPNRIIAVSSAVRDYLIDFGVHRELLNVIENGVDFVGISNEYSHAVNEAELALVFLGRLEPQKGLDVLLDALAILDQVDHGWSLDLIGDGSSRSDLEKKSKELRLSRRIRFHGIRKNPLALLADKSLFCMPSRREGFPISLLEALSVGLPAVVSNVGILPIIIKDGFNGFVFDNESPAALAKKLIRFRHVSTDEKQRMRLNARKTAAHYCIRECVSSYQNLFVSVLVD